MNKILPIAGLIAGLGFSVSASALVVTTTDDATLLSNSIIGSGVNIISANYSGGSFASGTFSDGLSSGLGMDSGIILTTGTATDAIGPNSSGSTGTSNGSGSDADLAGLIPGYSVYDATYLSIDFTSDGGDVFFNYIFASEEYDEFVNSSYNDVFGLFLDSVNIANVLGTTDPVTINNVNNGVNSIYYNDNTPPVFDIEYDGFTDVFTASFFGLSAGMHTLKFAVGDAGDSAYDSAVFIQAGSLSDTNPVPVPVPAPLALLALGLIGLSFSRRERT